VALTTAQGKGNAETRHSDFFFNRYARIKGEAQG
jgi:hypothetical protein